MKRSWGLWAATWIAATSCSTTAPVDIRPPETALPRWEETWSIATHNSYWADRGVPNDAFASGVGERILDQLLGDGARAVEIDVHRDRESAGRFLVYHTEPGNGVCGSLADCLAILRAFHDALPQHSPTLVVLELKEVAEPNFDDAHTMDDLDAELREGLGDLLFSPKDQLDRCAAAGMEPDATTGEIDLGACVDQLRWPAIDAMRGRFVVGVLGNWDVVATGTADWAKYATTDLPKRAAFPMSSTWKLDYGALPPLVTEKITKAELDRAARSSVLVQVEDTADPLLAPSLARGAIVRIDNAFSRAEQFDRLVLGAQLLQTDTPWVRTGEYRIDAPVRSFREDARIEDLAEPGRRLALLAPPADHRVTGWVDHPSIEPWEFASTLIAGHDGGRACLAATTVDGASLVLVCRERSDAPGLASNQSLGYEVVATSAGQITNATFVPVDQRFAERLSIRVVPGTVDTCIEFATGTGAAPLTLAPLGDPFCVVGHVTRAGIVRVLDAGKTPALFYRTTMTEGGVETDVRATDLTVVTDAVNPTLQEPPTPAPGLLMDLGKE